MKRQLLWFLVLLLGALAGQSWADGEQRLEKVDLRGVPLSEACRLIADQSGMNLLCSQQSSSTSVSLYLKDVRAKDAVDALAQAHGLLVIEQGGITRLMTVDERKRAHEEVREERTSYFTLLYPNVFDVAYAVRNLFGRRVELRMGDGDNQLLMDLQDRLTRFDLLDNRTQGIGSSSLQGLNNFGFNGQRQNENSNLRNLDNNATRDSSETFANAPPDPSLGPIIHVTAARRQNKLVVRTADVEALGQIERLVRELDVPTAMVLLEVRILSIELSDGMSSFFEYQWADGKFSGDFSTGSIASPVAPALGVGGTGFTPGNFIFQFVDSNFAARMQLLEKESRVKLVSTPILLTANNEVSRLFVGREVPLNRSFSGGQVVANESTTSTVAGSTGIEFRPVGTTLLITPNINADRTVTLRILQEKSDVNSTAQILVPSGNEFVTQNVSVVSSQSVSGTIVAKDELAVAFGGLIEEGTQKSTEKVPLLGDLPVVGALFRRDGSDDTRREIVVVVRPFVMGTPADQDLKTRELLERLQAAGKELPGAQSVGSPSGIEVLGLPKR